MFGGPKRFNRHKKSIWIYPDLESARRPLPHCKEVLMLEFNDFLNKSMDYDEFHEEVKSIASESNGSVFKTSSSIPEQFKQEKLSDLIWDLNLSKEAAEVLASRLKDKKFFGPRVSVTFYRTREKELLLCFSKQEVFVYCKDIDGHLLKMGVPQYRA